MRMKGWFVVWLLFVIALNVWMSGSDGIVVRVWNGLWNWNEHLYGHWAWWEEVLDITGSIALLAFGYFLGKYGFYPKRDELPKWMKWLALK